MPQFGRWTYKVDRDATIAAYRAAEKGGAERCECADCRNFCLARAVAFPESFVEFLAELGVDPTKESEVFAAEATTPGLHAYAGYFHFVGSAWTDPALPADDVVRFGTSFTVQMGGDLWRRLRPLEKLQTVQLVFHADDAPWLLGEEA